MVYGVGTGSQSSHAEFVRNLDLPFPLLVDTGGTVSRRYRAWFIVPRRTVYAIDAQGKVCFAQRGYPKPSEIAAALP